LDRELERLARDQAPGPERARLLNEFEQRPDRAEILSRVWRRAERACWRGWALVDEVEFAPGSRNLAQVRPWLAAITPVTGKGQPLEIRGVTKIDALLRLERHLYRAGSGLDGPRSPRTMRSSSGGPDGPRLT
jgi:hypothetical protein